MESLILRRRFGTQTRQRESVRDTTRATVYIRATRDTRRWPRRSTWNYCASSRPISPARASGVSS